MRFYKRSILPAAAALLLLSGCSKDPGPAGGFTVEARIGSPTKVAYEGDASSFEAGDRIAVYAWLGDPSQVPATRVVDGVVNTLGSDEKWTPASPMYWKPVAEKHYFLGVSPVHAISSFTADPYALSGDPASDDLLIATRLEGLLPGSGAVALPFGHAMAKLTVNLKIGTGVSASPVVSSVSVMARTSATVNYITGEITASGDASDVALAATAVPFGYTHSYSGILVPQSGVKAVTVMIDGYVYTYTAATDIPLVSGSHTTLTLVAGLSALELESVSINDWVDDAQAERELALDRAPLQLNALYPRTLLPMQDGWQAGDVVFVFFSGQAAPRYLEMKWNGAAWDYTPKNDLSLGASETGTMRAFYLPFASDSDVSASGTDFAFSAVDGCYLLSAAIPYDMSVGVLRAGFDLQLPAGDFLFFVEDAAAAADKQVELREPHLTPIGLLSAGVAAAPTRAENVHGAPLTGHACTGTKKGYAFYGTLSQDARGLATDYYYTLVRDGWQGSYFSQSRPGRVLYAEGAVASVETLPVAGWKAVTDYRPIDLGCDVDDLLRGGKKRIYWSSRNVGAIADVPDPGVLGSIQDTWGDYFAWGEVEPYYQPSHAYDVNIPENSPDWKPGKGKGYTFYSYKWCMKDTYGWSHTLTKYCYDPDFGQGGYSDSLTVLEPEDDAAHYNLGGAWRMQTAEEWEFILERFIWTWDETRQGFNVTSNVAGFNDRWIFLPTAGLRLSLGFDVEPGSGYTLGGSNYWTSSLDVRGFADPTWGRSLWLINSRPEDRTVDHTQRYYGQPVRPVSE